MKVRICHYKLTQNYYFFQNLWISGQKKIYSAGMLEIYWIIYNNALKQTVLHYLENTDIQWNRQKM